MSAWYVGHVALVAAAIPVAVEGVAWVWAAGSTFVATRLQSCQNAVNNPTTQSACADGDCTNEVRSLAERAPSLQGPGAQTINGIISKFKPSDAEALERFADEAAVVQPQRGMESFASTWKFLARFAPQHNELADGLFVYRVSNQIRGAMTVSNGPNALEVGQLEGLGEGAGTRLLQSAVQESIRRGYNGRLMLESADQAIRFYEKLGFVLSDPRYNVYTLSEQAAQALLQR